MSEETLTPHIADVPPTAKLKRAKRKATARLPRVNDPGIVKLREQHAQRVSDYRQKSASARILKTILEKRLAQLTMVDKETLFDALRLCVTPGLPIVSNSVP